MKILATCLLLGSNALAATFPISENFDGKTTADLAAAGWLVSGNATVTGNYLRLTQAINNQSGSLIYNQSFSSTLGINVQFDYFMGLGNGADGISFFLLDGSVASPTAGAPGGSLGYLYGGNTTPGVSKAYIGIGFDRFGNFVNSSIFHDGLGSGTFPNRISIRGPATANNSVQSNAEYDYVTGSAVSFSSLSSSTASRKVNFTIKSDGTVTLQISTDNGSTWTTIYSNFNFAGTSAFTGYSTPSTFKLGFAASTGGVNNEHRIDNLVVTVPVDLAVAFISSPSGTQLVGATVNYTITVTNNGPNADTAAQFSYTVPSGLSGVTWSTSASGGGSSSPASGSGNVIAPTLNLPVGAVVTFTVLGTVASSAVGQTLTHTARATPSSGFGDPTLADSTATVATTVNSVATLTVTGVTASNKLYDGTTAATLNLSGAALSGVVTGDTVTLNTGSASGAFADKNIGTGKTVTVSGLTISGASAANYSLTQPTTTANITAKGLTVTGVTASNKVYDGTTTATLNTASAALSGVISGDTVTLGTSSASGAFSSKTVGNGKTVTVSGLTLSGADSGNYTLTQPSPTANITAATLTVTGITANNKPYDNTTTASLNLGAATLVGVVSGDIVTLNITSVAGTFVNVSIGTGKTVSVSGLTLGGPDAGNYTLTQPTTTASIRNNPPTLASISDLTILEDAPAQTVNLSGITAGPNNDGGQTLTITATSNNTGLIPNPTVSYTNPNTTGTLTFTPVANANGSATITVTVMDDGGTANGGVDTLTKTFTVTVTPVNDPPTLAAITDQTILEDAGTQNIALGGISAGPSNESQTLTVTGTSNNATLIANPTITYTSPGATGLLTYAPVANANGTATITVTVTDDGGTANGGVNTTTRTFNVTVTPVNDPPTLAAISNISVAEDSSTQTINLSGITVGPANEAGQTLTITATSSNPNVIPNPTVNYTSPNATGTLSFTPVPLQHDKATITVVVKDNGGTANGGIDSMTNQFVITVYHVNHEPTLAAISDQTIPEQATWRFAAAGSDVDGDPITYSLDAGAPDGATINALTGALSWTPTEAQGPGIYPFSVRVKDPSNYQVVRSFRVTVTEVNQAPVLAPIADQTVSPGGTAHLNLQASDSDIPANHLTFSLDAGAPIGASVNALTGEFSWTPTTAQSGSTASITARVTDDGSPSLTAAQTFRVVVRPNPNSAPIMASVLDQRVAQGQLLTVLNGAVDLDLPPQKLTWSLGPGSPAGMSIDEATGVVSWTPVRGQGSSTNQITVTVTDDGSPPMSASRTFTVVYSDSSNYSIFPSTFDAGGRPATSLNYSVDASLGGFGGVSQMSASAAALLPGFAGQISEPPPINNPPEVTLNGGTPTSPSAAGETKSARPSNPVRKGTGSQGFPELVPPEAQGVSPIQQTTAAKPASRLVILARELTLSGDQTGFLSVELEAHGDENAIGFSLYFNPVAFSFIETRLAGRVGSALLLVNSQQASAGRIGVALALPAGQTFAAGTSALIEIGFRAWNGSAGTETKIGFGDQPVVREIVSPLGTVFQGEFVGGSVRIVDPNNPGTARPPPFKLEAIVRKRERGIEMRLVGELDEHYTIEVSQDLTIWTKLKTVTLGGNVSPVLDEEATGFPGRFYRAVMNYTERHN